MTRNPFDHLSWPLGARQAGRDLGITVPEEMSIIAFDPPSARYNLILDGEAADLRGPPKTTGGRVLERQFARNAVPDAVSAFVFRGGQQGLRLKHPFT
jgi:hypothetical protein